MRYKNNSKDMLYPEARSFLAITITGQQAHFRDAKLNTRDAARAPEFQDAEAAIEAWITRRQ